MVVILGKFGTLNVMQICNKCGRFEDECDCFPGPLVRFWDGHLIHAAPKWLRQRMEALRQLPPPSLEEVQRSFAASAEFMDKYGGFPCVKEIKEAKYIR